MCVDCDCDIFLTIVDILTYFSLYWTSVGTLIFFWHCDIFWNILVHILIKCSWNIFDILFILHIFQFSRPFLIYLEFDIFFAYFWHFNNFVVVVLRFPSLFMTSSWLITILTYCVDILTYFSLCYLFVVTLILLTL